MTHWGTSGGQSDDDGDNIPDLDIDLNADFDVFPMMDYFREDTSPTTGPSAPTTSTSAPTTSSSGEKRTRGVVTMNSVKRSRTKGNLVKVRFNEFGQAIGKESTTMAHFIGSIVRNRIPIVYPKGTDWRSPVMNQYKEALWEEITSTFEGIGESRKKEILSSAGVQHRRFRTWLRNQTYCSDTHCYAPLPPVPYRNNLLVMQHWQQFVIDSMEEDFKAKSLRNKVHAKGQEARHRGSSRSLARIRDDLIQARKKDGCEEPNVSRLDIFVASRSGRDGKVPDPAARHIIEEAGRISQTLTPEEAYEFGPGDILTQAIGRPEHPGRLRALGYGATAQRVKAARGGRSETEFQILNHKLNILTQRVEKMDKEGHRASSPGMSSGASCEGVAPSMFSAEVNRKDFDEPQQNINKVGKKCFLYLNSPVRLVARGTMYESANNNFSRVIVDSSEPGEENSLLPRQNLEPKTVGTAVGHFIEWPTKWIKFTMDIPTPKQVPKTRPLPTPKQVPITQPLSTPQMATNRPQGSQRAIPRRRLLGYPLDGDLAHDQALMDKTFRLLLTQSVQFFCDAHFPVSHLDILNPQEMSEVYTEGGEMTSTTINMYLRYLGEKYLSRDIQANASYSFISPHAGVITCPQQTQEWHTTLVEHMVKHKESEHLIFWPTNVTDHWVLTAINMSSLTVYFMDPLGSSYVIRDSLVQFINAVIISYRSRLSDNQAARSFTRVDWKQIQAPIQEDHYSCGHFVCCYIEDIIKTYDTNIPPKFVHHPQLNTYDSDRIQQFRRDWFGYVHNR